MKSETPIKIITDFDIICTYNNLTVADVTKTTSDKAVNIQPDDDIFTCKTQRRKRANYTSFQKQKSKSPQKSDIQPFYVLYYKSIMKSFRMQEKVFLI